MVNQDIVKYLEEGKRRGFSIQLLKRKLLEGGFQERDVDDAIAAMNVPQVVVSDKIDLFDKSQDDKYSNQPQTSMQQPSNQTQIVTKPLQGIQQKKEVDLSEKKSYVRNGTEGKWMKIGGILGIVTLLVLVVFVAINFLANEFLMNLIKNNLTVLILATVLVLVFSIYKYSFVVAGKRTNQGALVLGSWLSIISWVLYLALAVIAGLFVYEQAINFFSGTDDGGSYKIVFLILAILWVVALLLHVVGMILSSIGMTKAGRGIRFLNVAGIVNILVFICGLGFLAGIIIFDYNVLNAFSTTSAGLSGENSIMGTATIAIYSLIGLVALKAIAMIFEIVGLFDASRKFE